MLALGKGDGYWLYGEKNTLIKERTFGMLRRSAPATSWMRSAGPRGSTPTPRRAIFRPLCHLGNLCGLGRDLEFDPAKEEFVSDAQASGLAAASTAKATGPRLV